MLFLVTGGAGFIGSHLVDRLLARGHRVRVLDDLSTGKRENLREEAEFIQGSALDNALLQQLIPGCAGVFHLAARVAVQDCIDRWECGHQDNLVATMRIMAMAAEQGGVPVVYASSAAVYGERSNEICAEHLRELPISPYGADKLGCEHQARAFLATRGLSSVGLRFFNVYGPRQDPSSPYAGVISRFTANRLMGRNHTVFGDGLQTRDFINVADVVTGLTSAMDMAQREQVAEVFNICTGHSTSLLDLIGALDDANPAAGRSVVDHAPARSGDIQHSLGCPKRMNQQLEVVAAVTLYDGLAELLEWAREARPA